MDTQKKYWFPAKQYGWGWGLPTCWEGWAVFVAYATSFVLVRHFFPPARDQVIFLAGIGVCTAAVIAVCWLKGEPPNWRWGK